MTESLIEKFVSSIGSNLNSECLSIADRIDVSEKLRLKQKYWSRIQEKCDALGVSISKADINRHYDLYMSIAKVCYALFETPPKISDESESILQHFRKNKYCLLQGNEKSKIVNSGLKTIFNRLDSVCKNLPKNYSPKGVTRKEYTQGGRTPNQIPIEYLTDDELRGVKTLFDESEIGNIIRHYYGANFGAVNIRVWRYLPAPQSPGSSTKEGSVGFHFDGLAPNCFKLMMFDGNITPNHGCFEAYAGRSKTKILQAIGMNPCLIVEPNLVYHAANAPRQGLHRDTVEITVAPRIGDSIYIDAGSIAGYPRNPFADWSRR